ncbi:hypothetical protein Scep_013085 [Stephania cephalantha]|uniref:Uncharacterized protein n=1 Tax=Stephania cephalantha TaxID=152367 RepID=A0AAP0JGR6_9MAGN
MDLSIDTTGAKTGNKASRTPLCHLWWTLVLVTTSYIDLILHSLRMMKCLFLLHDACITGRIGLSFFIMFAVEGLHENTNAGGSSGERN